MSATTFVWFGILSAATGVGVAVVAWRQRQARSARAYALLMVVLSVWAVLNVGQLAAPSVAAKQSWLIARHALSPSIAVLFWVFVARYVDRSGLLSAPYLGPILVAGAALSVAAAANPAGLYLREATMYTAGSFPRIAPEFGIGFWTSMLYIGAVVGLGHGYFIATLRDSFSVYRRQLAAMVAVGAVEFGLAAMTLSNYVGVVPSLNPWPYLDLTAFNFVFVAVPLGWSYFRQSLFDLRVIDREAVVENMDDALFVLDTSNVVRSVNEAGERLIGETAGLEGRSASEVFAATPVLLEAYRAERDATGNASPEVGSTTPEDGQPVAEAEAATVAAAGDGEDAVELVVDGERRWYDVRLSAIRDSDGERTGTVLVARDVTVRRRQRRMLDERTEALERRTDALRRQNDRLNQFASIVSHDLRNPLQVAQGRLELARADPEREHLDAAGEALGRMEAMVEDLLTMARAGQTIESAETVRLAGVAEDAWEHTETQDSELGLHVSDGLRVEADRDRLLHVFENLFRNAIEHGDPPVSVLVGTVDAGGGPPDEAHGSGFFVEDDGPGIPDDKRTDVFEHGFTTSDEGTGFGLSIVDTIVEAHGWEIHLGETGGDGARFEITGVEFDR